MKSQQRTLDCRHCPRLATKRRSDEFYGLPRVQRGTTLRLYSRSANGRPVPPGVSMAKSATKKKATKKDPREAVDAADRKGPSVSAWLIFPSRCIPLKTKKAEFRLLDRRDLAPVALRRVNEKTGKEVPWNGHRQGMNTRRRICRTQR